MHNKEDNMINQFSKSGRLCLNNKRVLISWKCSLVLESYIKQKSINTKEWLLKFWIKSFGCFIMIYSRNRRRPEAKHNVPTLRSTKINKLNIVGGRRRFCNDSSILLLRDSTPFIYEYKYHIFHMHYLYYRSIQF